MVSDDVQGVVLYGAIEREAATVMTGAGRMLGEGGTVANASASVSAGASSSSSGTGTATGSATPTPSFNPTSFREYDNNRGGG